MMLVFRLLPVAVMVLLYSVAAPAQDTSMSSCSLKLDEVKIHAKKKPELFLFSSFEQRIHISLNPHHDEARYTLGPTGKQPDRFTAASFLHNDTTSITIQKIEGRLSPFFKEVVQVKVMVIQYGRTIASIDLSPEMIVKDHFVINTDPIAIGTGEFYVLYVCNFLKDGALYIAVNPKKEFHRFSFNGAAEQPASTAGHPSRNGNFRRPSLKYTPKSSRMGCHNKEIKRGAFQNECSSSIYMFKPGLQFQ